MSRLDLFFFFLLFWKGTLDLIWHIGCQGPVSLTVWRVHSRCPHWRKTEQVEKELFPLEKHQGDYFCSFKLLKRGLGQRKGGGGVQLWAADCFTCQICNAFLRAGSWLNSGPWRSGRGSPKPGEFQTSCFGVPLARTWVVARHLQTVGSHLPIDWGQQPNVTHLPQFGFSLSHYLPPTPIFFFSVFSCLHIKNSLSKQPSALFKLIKM